MAAESDGRTSRAVDRCVGSRWRRRPPGEPPVPLSARWFPSGLRATTRAAASSRGRYPCAPAPTVSSGPGFWTGLRAIGRPWRSVGHQRIRAGQSGEIGRRPAPILRRFAMARASAPVGHPPEFPTWARSSAGVARPPPFHAGLTSSTKERLSAAGRYSGSEMASVSRCRA